MNAIGAPSRGAITLLLPARDEAATVASVVTRTPDTVAGLPVSCVVVDDGSTDGTAELARRAGADVVVHPSGRGLGAAVRTGLRHALANGARVVAFCDADGEYAPEQLALLVEPILRGDADYVVGSRFTGTIHRMHAHRRIGNRALTWALRHLTGTRITDGQSGYRALSARTAAAADIIHDYNYAQVLTLNLLRQGYRYAEVPITYAFRQHGRSFVRLPRYLCAVIPAIWWELRRRPPDRRHPGPIPARSDHNRTRA